MEDDNRALLPFRRRPPRQTERVDSIPPDDPLLLFAPEPASGDSVPMTAPEDLEMFQAESPADEIRSDRDVLVMAGNHSPDEKTLAATALWILTALLPIGLIVAAIYFALE